MTHCLLFFAPAASLTVGGSLLLTHVSRFAFLFISAAMLAYAYPDPKQMGLKRFWRRRLTAVALPYVTWTCIYFLLESFSIPGVPAAFRPTGGITASPGATLERLGYLLIVGYYQLYFLVLLLEFYVLYPALAWILRRTEGQHRYVLAASGAVAVATNSLVHWGLVPAWMSGAWATRELWNYQIFLVTGALMAWHYEAIHQFLHTRWRLVVGLTAVTVGMGEGYYALGASGALPRLAGLNDASGPFQPALLPMFFALIGVIYLTGLWLDRVKPAGSAHTVVHELVDDSYGIYLSQVVFISALAWAGWGTLEPAVPWPVVAVGAAIIVYVAALAFTAALARLPWARATTGGHQRPWRTQARPAPVTPAPVAVFATSSS